MNRVRSLTLVGIAIALCGVCANSAFASSPSVQAEAPKVIRIGYQIWPMPFFIAKQKGWFKDAFRKLNAKVTFTDFSTGHDLSFAMMSNSIDIGINGSTPTVSLMTSGAPISPFMILDDENTIEGLAVKRNAGISNVSDLRGKTIGVPFGSTSNYGLLGALKTAGLSVSDVKLLNLKPSGILAAWLRGNIQAAYVWDPTYTKVAAMGGKKLQTIGQLRKASNGKYQIMDFFVVRNAFAKKYPLVLKTFVSVIDKATLYERMHTKKAAKETYAFYGFKTAQQALAEYRGDRYMTGAQQRSSRWMGTPGHPGKVVTSLYSVWNFLYQSQNTPARPSMSTIKRYLMPQFLH